jgi:hypothetical protein
LADGRLGVRALFTWFESLCILATTVYSHPRVVPLSWRSGSAKKAAANDIILHHVWTDATKNLAPSQ